MTSDDLLILMVIDELIYFYVPAIEGKRRLRVMSNTSDIPKETLEKAKERQKALRKYYNVFIDKNTGEYKIKF